MNFGVELSPFVGNSSHQCRRREFESNTSLIIGKNDQKGFGAGVLLLGKSVC